MKKQLLALVASLTFLGSTSFFYSNEVEANDSGILINEIKSQNENDWVELYNSSNKYIDISGYRIDDSSHKGEPLAEGTKLAPKEFLVLYEGIDNSSKDGKYRYGDFGISDTKESISLIDKIGNVVDSKDWDFGTDTTYNWGRYPDGGNFRVVEPSEGYSNYNIRLNEINTNKSDYIEVYNAGNKEVNLKDWKVLDDADNINAVFDNLIIKPGQVKAIDAEKLGKSDKAALYGPSGVLVDSGYKWSRHARGTYQRVPDGSGDFKDQEQTRGNINDPSKDKNEKNVIINEVEASTPNGHKDYVELYNKGTTNVDISGWIIKRDKDDRSSKIADNTIIKPGEYYLLVEDFNMDFPLDKDGDGVSLFNKSSKLIDHISWDRDISRSYGRDSDGSDSWAEIANSPGQTNSLSENNLEGLDGKSIANPYGDESDVVINEVESKDASGGNDYIEIYNKGDKPVDISGWYVADDKDRIPGTDTNPLGKNTIIEPGQYVVFEEKVEFNFGLGKSDSARLFNKDGKLIDELTWDGHYAGVIARIPDGSESIKDGFPTKGSSNSLDNEEAKSIKRLPWPGLEDVRIIDERSLFNTKDLSGLDYHEGWIYGVNNKKGTYFVFKVNEVNDIEFYQGFDANGKEVSFTNGRGDLDSEGISLADDGKMYLAVERDNDNKNTNYNLIVEVENPLNQGSKVNASRQWDITKQLPDVGANLGIETIEWVSFEDVDGKLWDDSKNAPFNSNDYPNSASEGIFFVGLEENGNIYAFILNKDGTSSLVNTLDRGISDVMGLNYDKDQKLLWAETDNGYNNMLSVIKLNGEKDPQIVHVDPPKDMPTNLNNEGFVIIPSDTDYLDAYWFKDGENIEALRNAKVYKEYYSNLGFEKELADIIKASDIENRPDGYVTITFEPGDGASFKDPSEKQYYVKKDTDLSLESPEIIMDDGSDFIGFEDIPNSFSEDKRILAKKEELADIYELVENEKAKEGYYEVSFAYDPQSIDHLKSVNLEKRYAVKENIAFDNGLIPNITPNIGYENPSWYMEDKYTLNGIYKDNSKLSDNNVNNLTITADTRLIAHASQNTDDLVSIYLKRARRRNSYIEIATDKDVDQILVSINGGDDLSFGKISQDIITKLNLGLTLKRGDIIKIKAVRNGSQSEEFEFKVR